MQETPSSSKAPTSRRADRDERGPRSARVPIVDQRLVGAAVIGALLDAMTFGALRE